MKETNVLFVFREEGDSFTFGSQDSVVKASLVLCVNKDGTVDMIKNRYGTCRHGLDKSEVINTIEEQLRYAF